jgi:alpha-glucosidase
VATRWGGPAAPAAFAKLVLAMQLSLKGTPCLYQGDELAFAEADVPFELLQDPYGITFWPEFKGRDGCRTPMAWTDDAPMAASPAASRGCRSRRTTWPRRPRCRKRMPNRRWPSRAASSPGAASMPQLTRGDITFFDAPEPVLALRRDLAGERSIIAVFNLGGDAGHFDLPQSAGAEQMAGYGLPGTATGGRCNCRRLAPGSATSHNRSREGSDFASFPS